VAAKESGKLGSTRKVVKVCGIRVLVVEDHAVVREGTRQLIEQDERIQMAGEAESGNQAIRLAEDLQPDVILLDLALGDMTGIDVARKVTSVAPNARIIVLSAYDDRDYVMAAMEIGVAAYLLKTVRAHEIIDAIHAVMEGQVILHPNVASQLRHSLTSRDSDEQAPLSARELEVLALAARGYSNQKIADQLSISVRTVEGHLSHILSKLDVESRTEAVVYGMAQGWITQK
jgi:two-component system, NarL family, response regulator LiaR